MSVFRLQNNVPRVYVKESRDFQVLCRIFDALHGGVMYDITSMQSLISPLKIDDTLLRLYATKVGFFTNAELGDKVLRYIVAAFPYIIKNKGNKIGIEQAVAAILKAENIPEKFGVPITSIVEIDNTNYVITVYAPLAVINKKALKEVLKYIIPTGYDYKISNAYIENPLITSATVSSGIDSTELAPEDSALRSAASIGDGGDISDRVQGAYDTNVIIAAEDLSTPPSP